MSLDFLVAAPQGTGDGAPIARSPMEREARRAGATFEVRDGWNVAVAYRSPQEDADGAARAAGWVDLCHLGVLELQADPADLEAIAAAGGGGLELGTAVGAGEAWWCRLTPSRALVITSPARVGALRATLQEAAAGHAGAGVLDVSSAYGGMAVLGPAAREVFARFSAVDLRDDSTPVGALRPVSIARQPAVLVREAPDRWLFLFGAAVGQYMWTVVADAAQHLGGVPVGIDAVGLVGAASREEGTDA